MKFEYKVIEWMAVPMSESMLNIYKDWELVCVLKVHGKLDIVDIRIPF